MIQVSSEFKKAIKEPERKIKGYVEVLYDLPSIEITPTSSVTSTYTDINDMLEGNRVKQNYGTVDFLPLDGSMLTMDDTTNDNSGFISDYIVEHYFTPSDEYLYLTLSFEETTIKGLTIYLRDNAIKAYSYSLSDGTVEYKTLDDYESQIQIIFDSPKTITSVQLGLGDFEYIKRKLKIDRIDLGISSVYKDQDLIDFTVDEEVNKLVEEVPINETNITLNNMSDLFNPLNPTGIVPYLSENTLIKPYIGVLTENKGIEYVKMGEFYFDSYTNNSDATTTLVGKNILKQVEKDEITDGVVGLTSTFIDMPSGTTPNTTNDILNRLGYDYEFNPRQKTSYYLYFLDDINLMNYFKNIAMHDYSIFYADRDNKLIFKNPISNIIDVLTKNELINDAQFKKIDKINTMKRISKRNSGSATYEQGKNFTIFSFVDNSFVLKKPIQNFAIKNNVVFNAWGSDAIFTFEGVTNAEIKYGSGEYTFIQATGNIGDIAKFNCVMNNYTNSSKALEDTYTITNKQENERETILETQSIFNAFPGVVRTDLGQLEYTPSYEMSFDYNGDPSLEAGDYINVETPYGYKKLFIQKNRFKFDGGLEGSIEGVE